MAKDGSRFIRWIAYQSDEKGRFQVLRAALTDNDAAHAILVAGWREELARRMSERMR